MASTTKAGNSTRKETSKTGGRRKTPPNSSNAQPGSCKQFNQYIAVDDIHVNGDATQGENAADLGGITLGWDAFTKTNEYKIGKSIGGFTPAQRYFIGWAISWMNQIRPESIALRVKTDVHAPSFLRVERAGQQHGPILRCLRRQAR